MKPIDQMNLAELADHYDQYFGVTDMTARLRAIHEETRWIPVSEKLPDKNINVLVRRVKPFHLYEITAFQRDGKFYSNETAKELVGVCEWQRTTPPEGV